MDGGGSSSAAPAGDGAVKPMSAKQQKLFDLRMRMVHARNSPLRSWCTRDRRDRLVQAEARALPGAVRRRVAVRARADVAATAGGCVRGVGKVWWKVDCVAGSRLGLSRHC